jgi:Helix-turn-helix domain
MPGLLPPTLCYTGEEVAAILRLPRRQFYRLRKQLEVAGMPAAIICGTRLRYSKEAFDRWLNASRRDMPSHPENELPAVNSWSERLLQVYGEKR